jgi:phage tail tube protein FII
MALPRKLKNLNLFNDANSYVGVVKTSPCPRSVARWKAIAAVA